MNPSTRRVDNYWLQPLRWEERVGPLRGPAGTLAYRALREVPRSVTIMSLRLKNEPGLSPSAKRLFLAAAWCRALVGAFQPRASTGRRSRDVKRFEAAFPEAARDYVGNAAGAAVLWPRTDGALEWRLPPDQDEALAAAVALSTIFGVASGRLRACTKCGSILLRRPGDARTVRCERCRRQRPQQGVFAGPSGRDWTRFRWRLTQQAKRGTISPEQQARFLAEAARDLSRMTPDRWHAKWDRLTRRPRGRPRSGAHRTPVRPQPQIPQPLPEEVVERVRRATRL